MKPSWAVTKLTEAAGVRAGQYRSEEPAMRVTIPESGPWPRQKSRTSSRNRPFHSAHAGPKPPTW